MWKYFDAKFWIGQVRVSHHFYSLLTSSLIHSYGTCNCFPWRSFEFLLVWTPASAVYRPARQIFAYSFQFVGSRPKFGNVWKDILQSTQVDVLILVLRCRISTTSLFVVSFRQLYQKSFGSQFWVSSSEVTSCSHQLPPSFSFAALLLAAVSSKI